MCACLCARAHVILWLVELFEVVVINFEGRRRTCAGFFPKIIQVKILAEIFFLLLLLSLFFLLLIFIVITEHNSKLHLSHVERQHFIDCIKTGKPCEAPLRHGLIVQQMMEALLKSAETGKEVRIR